MNRYTGYKDSGLEWIGEIPSSWSLKRVGDYFSERRQTVDDKTFPPLSVTMNGIVDQLEDVAKTDNTDNRKLVREGDFVINSRSDRKGSSGLSKRDGSVSVINIVLGPRQIIPTYAEYLFKSYYFKEEFFRNGKGIHWDLWSTRWDQLKSIVIPVPNQNTQTEIANYLDEKTTQIDSLIEKIERKIELLKEQRTSLINQYVTKGLDPNVEMKDSGVDWIGEIPKHWKVSRIKFALEAHNDKRIPLSAEERGDKQGPYRYFGATSVIDHIDAYTHEGEFILIAEDGANLLLRNLRLASLVDGKFWVNNHAHVLKANDHWSNVYYCELLEQTDFTTMVTGAAQPKLTYQNLINIPIVVPSIAEREHIGRKVQSTDMNLDSLINKETKRIELLKEYRQSLISNVVTGKVRVVEEVA